MTWEQMKYIPYVNLPVTKGTPPGFLIQSVHSSLCHVFAQSTDEQLPLLGTEELGCFRPVDDEEFGHDGEDEGGEAFDDEDPAPAIVTTDPGHFRQCICEKLQTRSGMAAGTARDLWVTHPTPCPCQDDRREEQIEPPLQFVSAVVHRHQVHAPYFM